MKKTILVVFICCISLFVSAQVSYEEINSSHLKTKRQLKIKLPNGFNPESEIKHPLIVVFDGEYLFEPVLGQADYQSYFDLMPQAIIVGIVQGSNRYYDSITDDITGLPADSGAKFYKFIAEEVIPYIEQKYGPSTFRMAVGQDLMASFTNSYLFAKTPLFQAYVCISPDLQGTLKSYLSQQLSTIGTDIFYYASTYSGDFEQSRETLLALKTSLSDVKNQKLHFSFDDFKTDSYVTAVSSAISKSFHKIFEFYQPITNRELEEKVLPYSGTLDNYLTERYDRIQYFFGIEKPISEDEIDKIVKIAERREDFKSLERIGKFVKKLYPESLLGPYYLALHAEKMGKHKKAKKLYESALELEELSHITKEAIFSKIDELSIAETDKEIDDDFDENENK